jgi:hypothetical protein
VINVDFDNITSFGTGQYYVTLPYPALSDYLFSSGHLFDDSAGKSYIIIGQVDAGTDVMRLSYISSNGQLESFQYNAPKTLTVDDHFDVSGTYEIEG